MALLQQLCSLLLVVAMVPPGQVVLNTPRERRRVQIPSSALSTTAYSKDNPLLAAIQAGDDAIEVTLGLLEGGADVNPRYPGDQAALVTYFAQGRCRTGFERTMDLVARLSSRATLDGSVVYGRPSTLIALTPLRGAYTICDHPEYIRSLLRHGAVIGAEELMVIVQFHPFSRINLQTTLLFMNPHRLVDMEPAIHWLQVGITRSHLGRRLTECSCTADSNLRGPCGTVKFVQDAQLESTRRFDRLIHASMVLPFVSSLGQWLPHELVESIRVLMFQTHIRTRI